MRDILASPDLLDIALRTLGGPQGAVLGKIVNQVRQASRQQVAPDEQRQRAFIRWLRQLEGGVFLVVGRRGTGKTALTCFLGEFLGRSTKVVGIKQYLLPDNWEEIQPEEVTGDLHDCTVLVDDSSLYFNAMDYATDVSQIAHDLVDITRHRRVIMILNIQRTAAMDRYIYADPDVLFCKPPSKMFLDGERPDMRRKQIHVEEAFGQLPVTEWPKWTYVYSDHFEGMLPTELPSWWSDDVSRNKAHDV